jgi:class 3 adenylate cyclase/TolB-like protein/Tfp pilus assembly protein PilF
MSADTRRKLAAIMFTDLVGYSAVSNRNESLALELLEEHRGLLRPLFEAHAGREVKSLGDGFLIEFASALDAVQCALEIQQALGRRNQAETHERRIIVRIGIHLGDVVMSGDDVYGDGVNIAARLQQFADPGTICLSRPVYEQVRNKVELPSMTVRHGELKNIKGTIRVYQIWPGEPPRRQKFRQSISRAARTRRAASVGGALLGAVLLALFGRARVATTPETATPAAMGSESRIAVLPFHAIGLGKNEEYVPDAVTEDLILALSKMPGSRVIARSSVIGYRDSTKSAARIAAELNVGTLIEGSLRKSGNRIKATVSLVDPKTETTFWASESEEHASNLFELQGKLARSLTAKLRMRQIAALEPGPNGSSATGAAPDPQAFSLYLKGRYFMNLRSEESLKKGVALFKQAIEIDPAFGGPYVGLANCFGLMGYYEYLSPKEAFIRGMFYSDKALALNPESADALTSMASRRMYYDHDWAGAEAFYGKALELNPGYPSAHSWYADFLIANGRIPEARKEIALALELDPLSLIINTSAGHPEYFARKYDAAIAHYRATLELDAAFLPARLWLGRALMRKGELKAAVEALRSAARLAPESVIVQAALAQALAFSGRAEEARAIRAKLESAKGERYVPSYDIAGVDVALGETERALTDLEAAYEERSYPIAFAALDPLFDRLVSEPRFKKLAQKIRGN